MYRVARMVKEKLLLKVSDMFRWVVGCYCIRHSDLLPMGEILM